MQEPAVFYHILTVVQFQISYFQTQSTTPKNRKIEFTSMDLVPSPTFLQPKCGKTI
jgi:hypothetical protein